MGKGEEGDEQDIITNTHAHKAQSLFFYENMQEMLQETDFYQLEELKRRIKEVVDALLPSTGKPLSCTASKIKVIRR